MNTIREIQNLNKRELEANVSIAGSWHRDFDDTAYIYIGGLPFDLSEGDIITIFSQYGEPTYVNLIRDKESGKSKGFAFLKYEDQRSTDLAVDNLGGASIMGRVLKVDHTRYKRRDGEEEEERERGMNGGGGGGVEADEDNEGEAEERRPLLREEVELMKLEREHDEDDPMKEYLVKEKREEVAAALARLTSGETKREKKHKHHHRHVDKRRVHRSEEQDDQRRGHRHTHRRRSRSP